MKTLLALSFLLAASARAERPVIDLSGARVQAYPLALPQGLGAPEVAGQVQAVLAQDFERSGLFKLLDPNSFLAAPNEPFDKVDFAQWQATGAAALVKLSCEAAAEPRCDLRLYDVQRGASVLRVSAHGSLRQIAHRFADEVVKFFTQEPGVFQTRIAFVRETETGEKQIVVADSDAANPQVVVDGSINLLPAFSPDGRRLAFSSFRGGAGARVYTADPVSRRIAPLLALGDFSTGAAYSPDGTRVVFSASVDENTDVYLAQADGSNPRRLTDARGIDISASWSPDGKRIAFVSERSGTPQLYTMTAQGTDVRRLTFQGNYNQEPAWSPKGDLIAFSGRDEKRVFDIYLVSVETGKVARLTQNAGSNEKPAWAPNGRYLLFSSTRASGHRQIFTMGADGSNQRALTSEKFGASDPAWGPLGK